MSDPVLISLENHVAILTLNRPDELNAFSVPEMIEAFLGALETIKNHDDVRAVVLTGGGARVLGRWKCQTYAR